MGSPHRVYGTFLSTEATLLPIHGTLHPLEATMHPTNGTLLPSYEMLNPEDGMILLIPRTFPPEYGRTLRRDAPLHSCKEAFFSERRLLLPDQETALPIEAAFRVADRTEQAKPRAPQGQYWQEYDKLL